MIENNWNLFKFGDSLVGGASKKCQETQLITEEEIGLYGKATPCYTRTDGWRARNGRKGKTGWSQDELDRFNKLVELVRKGRADKGNAFNVEVTKNAGTWGRINYGNKKGRENAPV